MKGVVYTITLSVIMVFVVLFLNSLIINYESIQTVFDDLLISKKTVDDYQAVKYSLQRILGVEDSGTVNISFPFSDSSSNIGPVIGAFTHLVNTAYAGERNSFIKVDADELITVVNTGSLSYELVPYQLTLEKQPGSSEKMIISNISSLKGLYLKVSSDAFVSNNYWKPPGYNPGSFNFTFDEIGVPFSYSMSTSSNADYILEFEKDGSDVGSVDVSFEFLQNQVKIEERNIDFGDVDYVNFSVTFFFEESSVISTIPKVIVEISDYLNKTRVNGTV